MGKKYTIELLDECNSEFKGIMVFGLTQEKQISVELIPEDSLTPYTEPDIEQVRKEAYQQGLNNAWEAARKVTQVRKYGGYGDCLEEVFGRHRVPWDVFDYSASEAIEKIRQYEQEKEERIQVGDEVIRHYKSEFAEGDDAPSIFLSEEDGYFRCLVFNGRSIMIAEYPKNQYRKTGRHFPEIAEVLQKMRES